MRLRFVVQVGARRLADPGRSFARGRYVPEDDAMPFRVPVSIGCILLAETHPVEGDRNCCSVGNTADLPAVWTVRRILRDTALALQRPCKRGFLFLPCAHVGSIIIFRFIKSIIRIF